MLNPLVVVTFACRNCGGDNEGSIVVVKFKKRDAVKVPADCVGSPNVPITVPEEPVAGVVVLYNVMTIEFVTVILVPYMTDMPVIVVF